MLAVISLLAHLLLVVCGLLSGYKGLTTKGSMDKSRVYMLALGVAGLVVLRDLYVSGKLRL